MKEEMKTEGAEMIADERKAKTEKSLALLRIALQAASITRDVLSNPNLKKKKRIFPERKGYRQRRKLRRELHATLAKAYLDAARDVSMVMSQPIRMFNFPDGTTVVPMKDINPLAR